eukprot:878491-Pyramimonas_sp.AAC.1
MARAPRPASSSGKDLGAHSIASPSRGLSAMEDRQGTHRVDDCHSARRRLGPAWPHGVDFGPGGALAYTFDRGC